MKQSPDAVRLVVTLISNSDQAALWVVLRYPDMTDSLSGGNADGPADYVFAPPPDNVFAPSADHPVSGGRARRPHRIRRWAYWSAIALMVAGSIASFTILKLDFRGPTDPSAAMETTIHPGDLALAVNGAAVRRGDVILFNFSDPGGGSDLFVKRLIGLPGDHVACCDAHGKVTVNGKPLTEDYLPPGVVPSVAKFSVTLPSGQIWVMGDNRAVSYDSRAWGPIPERGIVARVFALLHNKSLASVHTPGTFVADGLAPPDTRSALPTLVACLAVILISLLLLPVMTIVGVVLWVLRRRKRDQPAAAPPFGANIGLSAD